MKNHNWEKQKCQQEQFLFQDKPTDQKNDRVKKHCMNTSLFLETSITADICHIHWFEQIQFTSYCALAAEIQHNKCKQVFLMTLHVRGF